MKSRVALAPLAATAALLLSACTTSLPVLEADETVQSQGENTESGNPPTAEQSTAPQSQAVTEQPQSPTEPTVDELLAAVPSPESVAAQFDGVEPTLWGMDIPGIYKQLSPSEQPRVALTLDACGGPYGSEYDADLINGLIERGIPATLFMNSRWIDSNPNLARELADNPLFEIGNHGTLHLPLSVNGLSAYGIIGTASPLGAAQEVWGNHVKLTQFLGKPPKYFRSGTAHYDDVALQIADAFGEKVVGFTVNADAGATFDAATVRSEVDNAPSGSVIIAHMNQPSGQTAEGMLPAIDDLLAAGYQFVHLDDITQ